MNKIEIYKFKNLKTVIRKKDLVQCARPRSEKSKK